MKLLSILAIVMGLSTAHVAAFDLPVFYRSSLFHGAPHRTKQDWATRVFVNYAQGSTKRGYNNHEHKKPLFSLYGPVDITRLGLGVQNKGTLTAQYWTDPTPSPDSSGSSSSCGSEELTDALFNGLPVPPDCTKNNGLIDLCGHIKAEQLDLTIEQVLFSGFYAQLFMPLRHVRINQLGYRRGSVETVNGVNIDNFVNNVLPDVLIENGFCISDSDCIFERFKKTQVPELCFGLGWGGELVEVSKFLTFFRGSVDAHVLIPLVKRKDENKPFAIPLGYNNNWGIHAQFALEIGLWRFFVLGGGGGSTLFFRDEHCIRMKTDKKQSGWLVLDRGVASVDQGTMWDAHAYVKAEKFFKGLSVTLGYSFTHEESTFLDVTDKCFLYNVATTLLTDDLGIQRKVLSKNDIVNSDERYKGWDQHVIHVVAEYDASVHCHHYAPIIRGEVSWLVTARRSFAASMYAIGAGIQAHWSF